MSLAVAVVLLVVTFWFIVNQQGEPAPAWWVLVGYAVVLHTVLIPFGHRMMIKADDEAGLIGRYVTRAFLGIGESVGAELIAIFLTFTGAPFVVIVLGAALALSGLWRVAPSQRLFRLCDAMLQARGTTIRMTEAWRRALTEPRPPSAAA